MKKPLYSLCLTALVACFVVFLACSKDTSKGGVPDPSDSNIPAEQTVTASLQGRVLDETGTPVEGAAVSSGVATTTTDINGIFSFKSITMSSRFGFVKVVKQGYFTGSRSIITNAGASNYVNIQLIPRKLKGSFTASTGGTITVQNGDTAAFPAAGVVNATTNATYTGNVNVYATYLDPTDSNLFKYMPGDLRGIRTNGKETALQSFGMLAVEMEGDAGEKLQLAASKKAMLTWAIPTSLQATAPATIPLWYFNDSTGRWIEEGSAVRVGNSYVGQVGHFSFWNVDLPYGSVNLKARLLDQHGNPVAYTYVQFHGQNWFCFGGYTDSSGSLQCLILRGVSMQMQVYTECNNLLGGANVGPAWNDQDLGTLKITINETNLSLTGTVVDCFNNPVANGYVDVYLEGLNYRSVVTDGKFMLPIHRCLDNVTQARVTAGDFGSSQQGSSTQVTVQTGSVDVGQLSACGISTDQFISLTFNGKTYNMTSPPSNFYYNRGSISTYSAGVSMGLTLPGLNGDGEYAPSQFYFFQTQDKLVLGPGDNTLKCTVTDFGEVNQFVIGTISGNAMDSVTQSIHPLTGNFKVRRTN